ncbi:MAG: threonylcarbamoyl-AMP synthase [Verrucomicrobia bacterium]|nr:MAG: threonylcarbamoyl-AMP synthase [Verrucomicrobiota bacterium]
MLAVQNQRRASAEIFLTYTPALFEQAVERAAELLRAGEVVALPTETVYGLAANALNKSAVARIFEIKGRPAHNPIIVHVSSIEMAKSCVTVWPTSAHRLAQEFWPGPLTLVLPRSNQIPPIVTAGGQTVGVRWPSHPIIQAVITRCGFPLAAPSANVSTGLSPTTADHVRKSLGRVIPLIVDGGPCQVGIESTVFDLTETRPRVLRPGLIHETAIFAVLEHETIEGRGPRVEQAESRGRAVLAPLRSPGLLPRHYAPNARLVVLAWRNDADLKVQSSKFKVQGSKTHVLAHTRIPSGKGLGGVSVVPHDPAAFARALYAELHRCDESGAELIIVEAPPPGDEWRAISDRLARAANE